MNIKTRSLVESLGSVIKVAEFYGVHRQTVYDWGEDLPELRVYQLEKRRPDLYAELINTN